jgi:IS30 family transposase
MKDEDLGPREIGRVLRRPHNTISDEVKRHQMPYERRYCAETAHERFFLAQQRKGNRKKLERNMVLKQHVIERLTEDQWSPEQIAGDLRERWKMTIVNHETIYQFIYSEEGRKLKLWLHLRRKYKPERRRRGTRNTRYCEGIPEKVSIHQRSEAANERTTIGHLETDSMQFSKQHPILSVQADRMTKRCVLTKLPNKKASETKYAIVKAIEEFGESHVSSITFDNGTENVKHVEIRDEYGIQTFFCDAYCSWQKGLVENTNGLIRQYLPLKTNMSEVTDNDISVIQEKLNNRPRKSLRFLTPNQAYSNFIQIGRIYP